MRGDKIDKIEVNIYNGGMASFADGNSVINAVQNNNSKVRASSTNSCEKFQNNKKQDYIDNWNRRLFLHIDNDERPLTLSEAFIMPNCNCRINVGNMKFPDKGKMEKVVDTFIKYNGSANMLIEGVPGIGKSSVISWLVNRYGNDDDIIVLRFRDWERDELYTGLLKVICNTVCCMRKDLENKIIVLDGFDEIKILEQCNILLSDFLNDILDFKNIKVLITSRTNYLDSHMFQYVFELLPFEFYEIKRFYATITGNELKNDLDYSNLDVLGIPVILYMAIMSDIDITKEATKPELYSKIFAEKGGIFDKFSYCGEGYDYGNHILRDRKNIKKYLGFLQETAFEMFDEDKLTLPRKENKIPKLTFQGTEINILEFPIKHLFDNTKTSIEFVHKSFYEYFVAEYIIQKLRNVIESDDYKEKLACIFGKALLRGKISNEIIEFLKFRIRNKGLNDAYDKVAKTFQLMLEDGMLYHTNMLYKNSIVCEMTVFSNMLEVLHLWDREFFAFNDALFDYIKYNFINSLNLSRIKLSKANLIGVNLCKANLRGADLRGADLSKANLSEANLIRTDLIGLDLNRANLIGVNLCKADLRGADLRGADLNRANLNGANLNDSYLNGANLNGAKLRDAKLRGANLVGAEIMGIDLREADLTGAIFDENQTEYLCKEYVLNDINVLIIRTNRIIQYGGYCKKKKKLQNSKFFLL